ncbi:MAG: SDR family NAD(P)-dependent oxidoreductase [Pseudomonadota bacterium]
MKTRNIIITGGHSGIGLALTRKLVGEGHKVGVIARSEDRLHELRDAISPSQVDFFSADLANQSDIQTVIEQVQTDWDKVDILFNNAGVLLGDLSWSPQKNEMHYEVNTLAPLLLTLGLKPMLDKSANPAVVNTSTDPVVNAKTIDFDVLLSPKKITKLFGSYVVSKTAMTAAMAFAAKAPEWANVSITSVAPGAIKTKMTNGPGMPKWLIPLRNLFFSSPEKGADRLYNAAFGNNPSGTFLAGSKPKPMRIKLVNSTFEKVISGLEDKETLAKDVLKESGRA